MTVVLYVFVFATGASGLIFQVTWQRYLSRFLGSDSIATAIILATFLGGLSFGYFLCGKVSTGIKNHFKVYAVLEGIIGLWCVLFPSIFHSVESFVATWSFAPPFLLIFQGMFCSMSLMAVPTLCMGGTIPLLTRGISRTITEASSVHAFIYAINTIGAFLGTLLAGFYLIPQYGLPVTIIGSAFLNLGAALFFYSISLLPKKSTVFAQDIPESNLGTATNLSAQRIPYQALYTISFLSGFYVMTLENVLIRVTNFSIGSTSYSFSLIVSVFILSIAVGSYVVGTLKNISLSTLFINQLLISILLIVLYVSLDYWPYWAHLLRIAYQPNISGFWGYYTGVFCALLLMLFLPVSLMGATIPLAFNELKRHLSEVGKYSGLLFSWNTLGSLIGSLIGGILLYYVVDNDRVFLVAIFLAAGSTCLAGSYLSRRAFSLGIALVIFSGALLVHSPFYHQEHFVIGTFRMRTAMDFSLRGATAFFEQLLQGKTVKFHKDDPVENVSVVEFPRNPAFQLPPRALLVNGKSDSDAIGDMYTLKLLTHLPALLSPSREKVMVIGLGTGVTAGEFLLYPELKQLDVAEISPAVIEALPYFEDYVHGLARDPRAHIHLGDAFRILGRSRERWDIIVSEPSNPWVNGVDMLFTQEYYRLIKEHLSESGMLVQWVQLYATNEQILGMMLNTLQQEFKYVRSFRANPGDLGLIASDRNLDREDLLRAESVLEQNPGVKDSLAEIQLDTFDGMLIREVWSPSYLKKYFSHFDLQTMDNPRLHYRAGKGFFVGANINPDFLLGPDSLRFLDEYLLVKKYSNWTALSAMPDAFAAFFRSGKNVVRGGVYEFFSALRLRAYLSDPTAYPLSRQEREAFQLHLLPFITDPSHSLENFYLADSTSKTRRRKIESLLDHVRTFRNWIVPYSVDGLKTLLEESIARENNAYGKNWYILQLSLLLILENHQGDELRRVVNLFEKDAGGELMLREPDREALHEVLQYLE